MNLGREEGIFKTLYNNIDGHSISCKGREKMNPEDRKYLIYGEIPFLELAHIFEEPAISGDLGESKILYDLGSGTGKIVVGTALILPKLEKIIGIELVKTLFDTSNRIRRKFKLQGKKTADKIEFINGDFLDIDYSSPSPDIIFMHYPMHNAEKLYLKLEEKLKAELKSGAIIISCIRHLNDETAFPRIATGKIKCTYSDVTVYYHRKI
ncbi:MAG: hypothetical protein LBB24_00255 [Rickettsiales bacterium]|jgi:precorrin-6B methylase 2|nr:hypothetical protein [Rickettsiales bacterium]